MKTEQLIRAMAADTERTRPVEAVLPGTVLSMAAAAAAVFLSLMPVRPDLAEALTHIQVLIKHAFPLLLAFGAFHAAVRLSRPGAKPGWSLAVLAAVPLLLVAAVIAEALVLPQAVWGAALNGHSRSACVTSISLMSLPILAGSLWAMRRGASTHPALSGAMAGLLSGSTAAAVYAVHCIEDSPLFYSVWYVLAILAATAAGALLGARLLRW